MVNQKKTSIWAALGQIALAVGTSYLSARISNQNTGWVAGGYRDQLIGNATAVVINTAAQQVASMQQPDTQTEPTTTTNQ